MYPLYDKFFTESEISDLLAFYRSTTGQKVIQVMPQLAGDIVRITHEILVPKISAIMEKMIADDIANAKKTVPKRRSPK
jgi:hypothetical protein